jgi:hypothetical protein
MNSIEEVCDCFHRHIMNEAEKMETDLFWVPSKNIHFPLEVIVMPKFRHYSKIYNLEIIYKDATSFNVKNAYDIRVYKHKSGGHDIKYSYSYDIIKETEYGTVNDIGSRYIETNTHDVVSIVLTTRKQGGVRESKTVHFD